MHVLIIDGHPDEGRLTSHLLDHYAASLGGATKVERFAARDLSFDLNLRKGYKTERKRGVRTAVYAAWAVG